LGKTTEKAVMTGDEKPVISVEKSKICSWAK
jgi:hypothetical protein